MREKQTTSPEALTVKAVIDWLLAHGATHIIKAKLNKVTPPGHLRCGDNRFVLPCAFSEHCEEILARHKIKYFFTV